MACSSGCLTQDHESLGACMRSKGVRAVGVDISKGFEGSREKAWNKELDAYAAARRQGIQPATTKKADIEAAVRVSDKVGAAYQA